MGRYQHHYPRHHKNGRAPKKENGLLRATCVENIPELNVEGGEIQKKRRGNHFEKGERLDEFKFFGTSKVEFLMMGLVRIGVANR